MTEKLKKALVSPDDSIRTLLEKITNQSLRIAIVVNKDMVLLGTITDGDIRRGLLRDKTLDSLAKEIMNKNPITGDITMSQKASMKVMIENDILCLPIVDNSKVIDLHFMNEGLAKKTFDNPVFLMAGGFGKRLRPLTNKTPKPLLKVGEKPILEITLERLVDSGFKNFYVSTHYKPEQVREYFGNGEKWGINLSYIHEVNPLGTAGGLGLLKKEAINSPVLLMNGDLLTTLDFTDLIQFHNETDSDLTICVNEYKYTIPYGVIELDDGKVKNLIEKPTYKYFVNAGIYLISPQIINDIEKEKRIDMTDIIKKHINKSSNINTFPIHEYWIDIGRASDFEKANEDLKNL